MEVGILPRDLEGFVTEKAVNSEFRNEVKLDKVSLALVVQKSVRVDAEALHHAERPGNAAVRHNPHHHIGR